MALHYLNLSPSSFHKAPLSSNILYLAMFHNSVGAMKLLASNFSLNLLHSVLVTLLLSPSTFHPRAFLSGTPSSCVRIGINTRPYPFVSIFSGLQRYISYVCLERSCQIARLSLQWRSGTEASMELVWMSVVSNRMKRSQECPEEVHETWHADAVILDQARKSKSSQSRDCHDLSRTHVCACENVLTSAKQLTNRCGRLTRLRKMYVRRGVLSALWPGQTGDFLAVWRRVLDLSKNKAETEGLSSRVSV